MKPLDTTINDRPIIVNAVEQLPRAEKPIYPGDYDVNIMAAIADMDPRYISAVDDWILTPNSDLLPLLQEFGNLLKGLYEKQTTYLIRGFGATPDFQDTMGINFDSGFWFKSAKVKVGDRISYANTRPISFTVDEEIALMFGRYAVVTAEPVELFKDNFVITNELSVLVSQRRNIEPRTQKEVILYPQTREYILVATKDM
jgi:hypothetical protein